MIVKTLATGPLLVLAFSAGAGELCYVPYEEFELLVPHVDLFSCPEEGLPETDYFCRLGVKGDEVTVYTFRFVGDNACLWNADEMSFAEFREKYGISYPEE